MSEPACKKARIDKSRLKIAKQIPSWLDLEPGIWESVFRLLNGAEDKKIVRLVCKSFQATANRTISHLELRNSIADDSNLSELAEQQLPGSLRQIESIRCCANIKLNSLLDGCFSMFNRLQKLHYDGWGKVLGEVELEAICSITSLRTLVMYHCHFDADTGLGMLLQLHQLKCLEFWRCQPHATGSDLMATIGRLRGLTHLNISKFYSFCDRGYHNLSSLSNLEGLQLGHSWMLGAGPEKLDFMSALGKLQKLSITKCFVADDNLSMLQELKSLRLLGICECNRVKGTVFKYLTTLTKLHGLSLEGSNQITDAGIKYIAQLTSIQQLHLGSSTSISLAACQQYLPGLVELRRLRLPRSLLAAWPASDAAKTIPSLKSYIAAPQGQTRYYHVIEDSLLQWAINQPEQLESGRTQILDWFHESRC